VRRRGPPSTCTSTPRPTSCSLYREAATSWHATGLGEDEGTHPERFEHFGIAPVEAMGAGPVPLVFAGGGFTETVIQAGPATTSTRRSSLWNTPKRSSPTRPNATASPTQAQARAKHFGVEQFNGAITQLLNRHRSSPVVPIASFQAQVQAALRNIQRPTGIVLPMTADPERRTRRGLLAMSVLPLLLIVGCAVGRSWPTAAVKVATTSGTSLPAPTGSAST